MLASIACSPGGDSPTLLPCRRRSRSPAASFPQSRAPPPRALRTAARAPAATAAAGAPAPARWVLAGGRRVARVELRAADRPFCTTHAPPLCLQGSCSPAEPMQALAEAPGAPSKSDLSLRRLEIAEYIGAPACRLCRPLWAAPFSLQRVGAGAALDLLLSFSAAPPSLAAAAPLPSQSTATAWAAAAWASCTQRCTRPAGAAWPSSWAPPLCRPTRTSEEGGRLAGREQRWRGLRRCAACSSSPARRFSPSCPSTQRLHLDHLPHRVVTCPCCASLPCRPPPLSRPAGLRARHAPRRAPAHAPLVSPLKAPFKRPLPPLLLRRNTYAALADRGLPWLPEPFQCGVVQQGGGVAPW